MPSLSFTEGTGGEALAIVKGGSDDGQIMYLHTDTDTKGRRPKPTLNRTKYLKSFPGFKPAEKTRAFARLSEALSDGKPASFFESEPVMKDVYEQVLKDTSKTTTIELDDDGMFVLVPNPDPKKREVLYICGTSGSGKSYLAREYTENYHKLFPSRGCYLISKLKEDETLDKLKYLKRINIQSLVDDPPVLEEFRECLIIFDDYDTLTGKHQDAVLKLIDDLAIQGRHTCTTMLCLSHYLNNYKKTRLILNEATGVVVYPQSTSFHALKYLLRNYIGVEEDDVRRFRKLGSRWLYFKKMFPQVMISQKNAEVLHSKD